MTMSLDVLIPHVSPVTSATKVRSTLLQSSLKVLKAHGHLDTYLARLAPELRDEIVLNFAASWLPIGHAFAHYQACERLDLTPDELAVIGQSVGDQIQGTFLSTLLRGARAAGMTPWTVMKNFDRFWARLFLGGSVKVTQAGPKDALIEVCGVPQLAELRYFRVALCGVVRASCTMSGSPTSYVKIAGWTPGAASLVLHSAWT